MTKNKIPVELTSNPDLRKAGGTGAKRTEFPVFLDRLPPCNNACPAGENIQAWLALAQGARFKEAWEIIMEDNPMPAVLGRVCYHPCEDRCNRSKLDETVSIHAVERFLGDLAIKEGWPAKKTSSKSEKRVMVIGAGPSGLSAAYHLSLLGHSVTIFEAGPFPGGMMHFGIPKYRLPRDILEAEIRRIETLGVKIVLEYKVTDVLKEKDEGDFDAVFLATGAHLNKRIDIPAQDATRMIDALSFLKDVEAGEKPKLGRRVVIYGGGNTAMDAARTAKRLGANETLIVYRRDREHMAAHNFEAQEAIEENVKIHWLRSIKQIDHTTLTVEEMTLDKEGWPQPTGKFETLEADSLILALGQDVDNRFLNDIPDLQIQKDGTVMVNETMMTTYPGIFAGGDIIPAERSVTHAIGHGKKAARHINAWFRNQAIEKSVKHEIVQFDMLNLWYYTDNVQKVEARIDIPQRRQSFDEVVQGLNQDAAVYEARRCLSCGNCFECDGCYGACPEKAIIKLGPGKRYRYDYDLCTGCAVCYEQCPCAAITMVPEKEF